MRAGVLFSGGKDSCLALHYAKKEGYNIACLITIASENPYSFMFHTPSITCVKKQAEVLGLPLVYVQTKGKKEEELKDLKNAIKIAIKKYKIRGIVSGAVESVYQAARIQRICNKLGIEVFNPLWQKNQFELLRELIENKFLAIISGVFAFPFDETWLGKKINSDFIKEIKNLNEKYKINPAGEGGEYDSLVLYMPEFKRKLETEKEAIEGEKNSWRLNLQLK